MALNGSFLLNTNKYLYEIRGARQRNARREWSPVERLVATGGGDRKVKLWDVGKGALEPRAVLGGSSAGINSVDFDSTG
ncbi:unnamed protein product [Ceratitis capitata]|uniref:(Mediterranean fruit fly) hypothetical protein n=1 Tax=Ceratitis capitata TaxID=7213 RepID=A0A811U5L0_CERCA|nr:unnamed protein product [Ceratitis capitata]